jgi:hypothetical protein
MTIIYITFTALAERWEVASRDHGLIGDLEPITSDLGDNRLQVARDANGEIREVVLDARSWDPSELSVLEEAFGPVVRSTVEHLIAEGDLEMSVRVPSTTDLDRVGTEVITMPGEPGIPVRNDSHTDDGVYQVPEAFDRSSFDPSTATKLNAEPVEIHLDHGDLRIVVPGAAAGRDLWVRISAAASGTLLHIAPVQPSSVPDGAPSEVHATWGLGSDLSRVHLRVTDDPTAPVGDQHERRIAWTEQLLAEAGEGNRQPGLRISDRRRAASEAKRVAEIIGDDTLVARAQAHLKRLRAWRIGRIGALVIGLGLLAGLLIGAALGDQRPADLSGGAVGPAVFSYEDRTTVRAAILGGVPVFRAGDEMSLTASLSTVIAMGFSDPDTTLDDETATQRARSTCIEAQNSSAAGNTYNYPGRTMIVRLTRLAEGEFGPASTVDASLSVIASVLDLRLRWNTFSSIIESCNSPGFGRGNRYTGEVVVSSFPETYEVLLPANLPAGLWEVQLVLENRLFNVDGALRIRIVK